MKRNIYSTYIGETTENEHYYFTTVKGMEMLYSALDQKRTIVVLCLQESLGFPIDIDLANDIDYNILGIY